MFTLIANKFFRKCYLATRTHSLVAFLCTKKDHSFTLSSLL
nr:MAG TPA: hypothetical protein [Caudoviricetes sp.]